MVYIGNAFSLQMVEGDYTFSSIQTDPEWVAKIAKGGKFTSCVGHADTAAVISAQLGHDVPMNRITVTLKPSDYLYVAQVVGGRLPEGTTSLPDGFQIQWREVRIVDVLQPCPYCKQLFSGYGCPNCERGIKPWNTQLPSRSPSRSGRR